MKSPNFIEKVKIFTEKLIVADFIQIFSKMSTFKSLVINNNYIQCMLIPTYCGVVCFMMVVPVQINIFCQYLSVLLIIRRFINIKTQNELHCLTLRIYLLYFVFDSQTAPRRPSDLNILTLLLTNLTMAGPLSEIVCL